MYNISSFWIIVVGILNLITIIVFFVMAFNVRKIKKVICREDIDVYSSSYWDKVREERAIGNKDKALELLKRGKYQAEKIRSGFIQNHTSTRLIDEKIEQIKGIIEQVEKE